MPQTLDSQQQTKWWISFTVSVSSARRAQTDANRPRYQNTQQIPHRGSGQIILLSKTHSSRLYWLANCLICPTRRGDGGECIPRDKQLSVDMDKQRLRTHGGGRVGSSLTEEDLCECVWVCVWVNNIPIHQSHKWATPLPGETNVPCLALTPTPSFLLESP